MQNRFVEQKPLMEVVIGWDATREFLGGEPAQIAFVQGYQQRFPGFGMEDERLCREQGHLGVVGKSAHAVGMDKSLHASGSPTLKALPSGQKLHGFPQRIAYRSSPKSAPNTIGYVDGH